ncbi:MAG TPA: hypothetical protein VF607_02470 [Verrucomicrobiae bacterium]
MTPSTLPAQPSPVNRPVFRADEAALTAFSGLAELQRTESRIRRQTACIYTAYALAIATLYALLVWPN